MKEMEGLILKKLNEEEKIDVLGRIVKPEEIISVQVLKYEKETETIIGTINLKGINGGNNFVKFRTSKIDLDEEESDISILKFSEIIDITK